MRDTVNFVPGYHGPNLRIILRLFCDDNSCKFCRCYDDLTMVKDFLLNWAPIGWKWFCVNTFISNYVSVFFLVRTMSSCWKWWNLMELSSLTWKGVIIIPVVIKIVCLIVICQLPRSISMMSCIVWCIRPFCAAASSQWKLLLYCS